MKDQSVNAAIAEIYEADPASRQAVSKASNNSPTDTQLFWSKGLILPQLVL
jgi:hypothetical protein